MVIWSDQKLPKLHRKHNISNSTINTVPVDGLTLIDARASVDFSDDKIYVPYNIYTGPALEGLNFR